MLGETIGSYQVLEEIGRGGMATVYRARQASVDRDVALQAFRRSIANDPEAVQRFQREARPIARLEHPHISRSAASTRPPSSMRSRPGSQR
jgi:serine/threonine-protein kinase